MTCAWIETSSAETGSSQTISRGSTASARAMPIALPLPARELVRIAARVLGREADQPQNLGNALALATFAQAVQRQRLVQRLADGHPRIQRGERVLEDDLQGATLALAPRIRARSGPRRRTRRVPRSARAAASTSRPVVDLPQPDSPTRASVSPTASEKLTPSTALHLRR